MSSSEYKILLGEDEEIDQEVEGVPLSSSSEKLQPRTRATIWGLVVLLFVSLSFNMMSIVQTIHNRHLSISDIPTDYSKNPRLFCFQALNPNASQAGFERIRRFRLPSMQSIPTATGLLQTKPGTNWSHRLGWWLYRTTGYEQRICSKLSAFLGISLKASTLLMASITYTV